MRIAESRESLPAYRAFGERYALGMQNVRFPSRNGEIAGHLHLPADFSENRKYAAIVCVHPGSSVKEQTAGLYAARMAKAGYVALAFDASHQGESGGEPRHIEDPAMRIEDIRAAVDFLMTRVFVDENRIGILGVCAGGGYAVNAAMSERRIKAVGTVVAINIGRARRAHDPIAALEAIGRQRTLEARGERPRIDRWIPETKEGLTELDLTEAIDYYRTPRGRHPRSDNQLRFSTSAPTFTFDAFHLADVLLTQPLQVIVGGKLGAFGSFDDGHALFAKAAGKKDLYVIDGASHYDLYDRPRYVDDAAAKLTTFFDQSL